MVMAVEAQGAGFGGSTVTVQALYYYPVKSCAGIAITTAEINERGIVHDREFMVVNADTGTFLSQRELPRMALITPTIAAAGLTLDTAGMTALNVPIVTTGATGQVLLWKDHCQAVDQGDAAAEWLSTFLQHPCRLVRMAETFVRPVDPTYATRPSDQVGFADGFPLLLISQESLDDLNQRLNEPLLMNRFRPNIVISGGAPFGEDTVASLQIGTTTFYATKACARCPITTVDQATGERGKEPLRTFATFRRVKRGVLFGQNLIHSAPGTINVGEAVIALSTKEPEA